MGALVMYSQETSTELLLEITRCPLIELWFAFPQSDNPCAKIIASQHAMHPESLAQHQVPEPWSGNLGKAPLLFLSSNPSIDEREEYPLWSWPHEEIEDFFVRRYGGGRKQWIENGIRNLQRDGSRRKVRYWIEVRQRASEMLERAVRDGVDYALTEVVHCKSRGEAGVRAALSECSRRYLRRVIILSGARVIVALGQTIKATVKQEFDIPEGEEAFGPIRIGEHLRYVVFLPHPNAHGYRSFGRCFKQETLRELRSFLHPYTNPG